MRNLKHFRLILLLSCMLAGTGCGLFSKPLPPCNRIDLQPSYDQHGTLVGDATAVSNQCLDRMISDLDACYRLAK